MELEARGFLDVCGERIAASEVSRGREERERELERERRREGEGERRGRWRGREIDR